MMKNKVKELRARFGYSQENSGNGRRHKTDCGGYRKRRLCSLTAISTENLQSLLQENGGCLLVRGGKLR